MRKFLCIGHRGARGEEPENTLRSIRRALECGADGIEVDVYFVDGHLMVFHDRSLDRTTNGAGRLARKSFEYLRSLDAGKGEQIPTLEEVCDAINARAFLNIELKGPDTAEPVAAMIEQRVKRPGGSYGDFLVSSFRLDELRKLAGSKIPIGILFRRSPSRFAKLAVVLRATSVHTSLAFTTPRFVEQAHGRWLKVFVYTVNNTADIARMRTMGVDGVITDFPSRVTG